MRYHRVYLESFGYTLPEEIVTTDELERRLAPAYERLRLPEGRLELMTGIRERRFYPPGTRPGEVSIESGRRAIAAAGIDPAQIGALVHGSVCRDYLEPATACGVHHALGLPAECLIYDVSNACLGILTRDGAGGEHDRAGADSRRARRGDRGWAVARRDDGRAAQQRSRRSIAAG